MSVLDWFRDRHHLVCELAEARDDTVRLAGERDNALHRLRIALAELAEAKEAAEPTTSELEQLRQLRDENRVLRDMLDGRDARDGLGQPVSPRTPTQESLLDRARADALAMRLEAAELALRTR